MFLFLLPSVVAHDVLAGAITKSTVLVCYGRLSPETIKGYAYVILEPQFYNIYEIRKIKSQNENVLAYISLGEVNANAQHYNLLKDNTLGKNSIWDSYYLNLKSEKTGDILMDIIARNIELGYDGFFLDNIDNFTSFGPQPDQKAELIALLKRIHTKYPEKVFLQNAGLDLIGETAGFVDAVIIESVATNYTFNDKSYKLRDEGSFNNYVQKLKAINKTYNLPIILIEYADTMSLHNAVQRRVRNLGFEYFIGQIDLQKIPEFTN
jgi:hypothetical protein